MNTTPNVTDLERAVLGALCAGTQPLEARKEILRSLANYTWRSPDHGVIYEALRRSRQQDPTTLREFLAAEATRLGFPDIDFAPYFAAHPPTPADIEKLIAALLAAGPEPAPRS